MKKIFKDKDGREIVEGSIIQTRGGGKKGRYRDISIVSSYKGQLIAFGFYLRSFVFVANNDNRCPYLRVIGGLG